MLSCIGFFVNPIFGFFAIIFAGKHEMTLDRITVHEEHLLYYITT